jgi:hypothetical protein
MGVLSDLVVRRKRRFLASSVVRLSEMPGQD